MVNLLPEKLRKKEKKEIKTTYKIELTNPPKEKPKKAVKKGGSLLFFEKMFKRPEKLPHEEKYIPSKEKKIEFRAPVEIKEKPGKPEIVFKKPPKQKKKSIFKYFFAWLKNLFIPKYKIKPHKIEKEPKVIHKKIPEKKETPFYPKKYEVKTMPKIPTKIPKPPVFEEEKKIEEKKVVEEKLPEAKEEVKKIEAPPKVKKIPEKVKAKIPKPHVSLWARFLHWFRKLLYKIKMALRREKKVKKIPPIPKPIHLKEIETGKGLKKAGEPTKIIPSKIEIEKIVAKKVIEDSSLPPIQKIPKPVHIPPPPAKAIKKEKIEKKAPEIQKEEKKLRLTEPEKIFEREPFKLDVNLVPEEMIEKLVPKNRIASLIICVVITAVVVGLAYMGLSIYKSNTIAKIENLKAEINKLDSQIMSYREFQKEIINLRGKTEDVKTVLNKHIYWSNLFKYFEKYTISDVYYTQLAGDLNGLIKIKAVGKDFESVSRQLLVFEEADDFVDNVVVTSIKSNEAEEEILSQPGMTRAVVKSVSFDISLAIKPNILHQRLP